MYIFIDKIICDNINFFFLGKKYTLNRCHNITTMSSFNLKINIFIGMSRKLFRLIGIKI
jgi:hypothetical protein